MEESKNNDKKREIGNVEGTVDGEKDVGTERRGGDAKPKTVDAQNEKR